MTTPSATDRPKHVRVVAPPPLLFGMPLMAGLLLDWWRPLPFLPAGTAHLIGGVLAAGFLVGAPAVIAFRRAGTSPNPWRATSALVTSGPYRFTRNPMYLGMLLLYLSVTCWADTLWPFFFLPFVLGVMQVGVIRREEAYLEGLFGDEYRAYRSRVRRWL